MIKDETREMNGSGLPPGPPPRKPVFPPNQMLSDGAFRMKTESSAGTHEASPPPVLERLYPSPPPPPLRDPDDTAYFGGCPSPWSDIKRLFRWLFRKKPKPTQADQAPLDPPGPARGPDCGPRFTPMPPRPSLCGEEGESGIPEEEQNPLAADDEWVPDRRYSSARWAWVAKELGPMCLALGDKITVQIEHRDGRMTRFEF